MTAASRGSDPVRSRNCANLSYSDCALAALASLQQHLGRTQPGLERGHAGQPGRGLVRCRQQIADHLPRRLEMRGGRG